MASIIKDKARVFNANQFLNLFSGGSVAIWNSGTVYSNNDIVINNSREYVATTSGTSGATPPTHTTGSLSDGGVIWQHVKPALVTNFYDNNIFLTFGKDTEWDNELIPPQAENNLSKDFIDMSNLLFLKKQNAGNASMGIKRNLWSTGIIYDNYSVDVELDTIDYYVTNSSNRIYICIDNNGGIQSVSEPTDITTTIQSFKTGDGYTWKYMGEVSDINFVTNDYVPVKKVLSDNGSDQWEIQQNAKPNSLTIVGIDDAGATFPTAIPTINIIGSAIGTATLTADVLTEITLTDVGGDYVIPPYVAVTPDASDLASHQPTITVIETAGEVTGFTILNAGQYNTANAVTATISGGSGCTIDPVFTDYTLTGFTITSVDGGTGYSNTDTVTLDDGNGNTEAHDLILTPKLGTSNGLGSNLLEDCNAKYIIMNENLVDDETGYFATTDTFRQILVLVDPVDFNGDPASASRYYGPASTGYAGASANTKIRSGSGSLIYIDNIEVIQRTSNQQENIKIILKF